MVMVRRTPKPRTVYRYPVRFTQSQLDVASNLLASTGVTSLSALVHVAFAQLAKTAVGAPLDASQATPETKRAGSDPELKLEF
jgi:hypothetical protein